MFNLSFQQVLTILGALLPFLVPLGRALGSALESRLFAALPASKRSQLEDVVNTVVAAVEQQAHAGQIMPSTRKAQAVSAITTIAKSLGLEKYASPTLVDMLVEAAVLELNQVQQSQSAASQPVAVPAASPAL